MLKRIAIGSVSVLLLASPLAASADLLSDLQAQIQALVAQIAQLQAENNDQPDDYGTGSTGNYCPTLSITMQRGSRDATTQGQVSELQKFLADYYDIDREELVTGYFGRITESYVQKFQREHGLPAFGIVGSLTRAKIRQVCGGVTSTMPVPPPPPSGKCGVNTFQVLNGCGTNEYRNAYVQCHDGYSQTLGVESSCKPPSVWLEYAQSTCANRCSPGSVSIRITAPNEQAYYYYNQSLTVSWQQTGSVPKGSRACVTLKNETTGNMFAFPPGGGSCVDVAGEEPVRSVSGTILRNNGYDLAPGAYRAFVQVLGPATGGKDGPVIAQDESDNYFKIVDDSPLSCSILESRQKYHFDVCRGQGFENACFNKNTGDFQGCTRNSSNDCTVNNTNAAQNILCPIGGLSGMFSVAAPNGGETLTTGQTSTIFWNPGNVPSSENIRINLIGTHNDPTYPPSQPGNRFIEEVITWSTPNNGAYNWTVPEKYGLGWNAGEFRVKITAASGASDQSDGVFTIRMGASNPRLTVTSPSAGAEYSVGQSVPIQWTPLYSQGQSVGVFVLKKGDDSFVRFAVPNLSFIDGMWRWTIPQNFPSGDYYIRVGIDDNAISTAVGYSGTFRIKSPGSPSCSITSNKGSYAYGETITFSWTSTNATYAAFIPDTSGRDNLQVPGDKLPANGSQPIVANVVGNPFVTLGVYDAYGNSAQCSKTVSVSSPPQSGFTAPDFVKSGQLFDVSWSFFGSPIQITAYQDWVGIARKGEGWSEGLPWFWATGQSGIAGMTGPLDPGAYELLLYKGPDFAPGTTPHYRGPATMTVQEANAQIVLVPARRMATKGESVNISWRAIGPYQQGDWIALLPRGQGAWTNNDQWFYTDGSQRGRKPVTLPQTAGFYDIVYFLKVNGSSEPAHEVARNAGAIEVR